jgi:para-nitrobenzyl esterase
VIVYIYGGGNTIGSSGMALYDGESVARRGAIFVNFNYRVGALGFLAHPELSAASPHRQSGNYAYLDQIAGLQWVQRNIAKFGGNPAKVIVSGQSAGAGAVSLLQASPLAKGLFRGVVAMSGGVWGNDGKVPSLEEAEKIGFRLQEALKAKSLADMRQVAADRILALQEEFQVGATGGGSIRIGGANVDGYFLPKSPAELFASQRHNDVPVIAGFAHDESTNPLRATNTVAGYEAAARKLYGAAASEFLKLYPVASDSEVRETAKTAAREGMVERSARNWALAQNRHGKAPVYVYDYSRVHPYIPGAPIADQDIATIGAYHNSDVPYWFGTQGALNLIRPTRKWTTLDRELSAKMTAALIAFANTGDPRTPAADWPAWLPDNERLIEFGDTIRVLPMNTARLNFMKIHGGGPAGPRRTRD